MVRCSQKKFLIIKEKNDEDENCLDIIFDLDFSKFPGFRIGKSIQQQNGNSTQVVSFL
jgi:hypothetical protein